MGRKKAIGSMNEAVRKFQKEHPEHASDPRMAAAVIGADYKTVSEHMNRIEREAIAAQAGEIPNATQLAPIVEALEDLSKTGREVLAAIGKRATLDTAATTEINAYVKVAEHMLKLAVAKAALVGQVQRAVDANDAGTKQRPRTTSMTAITPLVKQ